MAKTQRKAVALISGGLDSMLAARVVMDQGVHVEGINFFTGFCVEGHTHAIRRRDRARPKRNNALWVAEQLGIRLHIIDIVEEYKAVLLNPRHGYGQNLNPCLDCKTFMVRKAYEWMREHGFDFIITGEVIGQRPMSQRRDTFPVVARESGVGDLLLRPLSAKLLPPTRPEREGWVDRKRLYGFHGRSRKPQMALAARYGFRDYAQPAGGCCFLTDEQYAAKLADLWAARGRRDYDLDDILLLKVGRHLRPRPHFKLIVGREEGENRFLEGYRKRFLSLRPVSHAGPLVLVDGELDEADLELAARITARFSKGRGAGRVRVAATTPEGETRELEVAPLAAHEIRPEWYVERRGAQALREACAADTGSGGCASGEGSARDARTLPGARRRPTLAGDARAAPSPPVQGKGAKEKGAAQRPQEGEPTPGAAPEPRAGSPSRGVAGGA